MFVKVAVLADGHGPSEKLIGIKMTSGDVEQVIVAKRILRDNTIEVGLALSRDKDSVLIELPRESTRGRWRIWIPDSEAVDLQAAE